MTNRKYTKFKKCYNIPSDVIHKEKDMTNIKYTKNLRKFCIVVGSNYPLELSYSHQGE